ncbi:MAG: hypothetical protein ACYDA8_07755 [Deferrisomatales bacterium]
MNSPSCPATSHGPFRHLAVGLGVVLVGGAALAGLCQVRARQCRAAAQTLEERGAVLQAVREHAAAIRYHVPLSPVTRESARRLLELGQGSESAGDRGTAVAAYQALAAALEAVARPLPVEPTAKAAAQARLRVLLGSEIHEPVRGASRTWLPSLLFALWCGAVCTVLSSPRRRRWALTLAVVLPLAWLAALRLV